MTSHSNGECNTLSDDSRRQRDPGLFKRTGLLRAIARAVANAQHEIDTHTCPPIRDVPKGAGAVPVQGYRIAELVIEHTDDRSNPGRPRLILIRVVPSAGQVGFLAELRIDGKTEEALVIS